MLTSILLLLLSLSISGSLVIMLVCAICRLLQKRLSHQWQYYIWIAAIVRLLFPFSPEENLIGYMAKPLLEMDSSFAYMSAEQNTQNTRNENSSDTIIRQSSGYAQSAPITDTKRKVQTMKAFIKRNMTKLLEYRLHLCIFWFTVAMLLLLRKITVYQDFIRFMKASSAPVDDIDFLEMLSKTESQLGIQKPIDLWSSQIVSSPMLIGFFHPCIILPEKDNQSKQAVYYIMLHELTHYQRRDMYYKWLVQLVLCIHWFNPFVHIMARQVNRLCELSCDEAVTAKLESGSQRKEYAATLLAAMSKEHNYKEQVASLTLTENKRLLKERMEFIMRKKETTVSEKLLTVFLTATVIIVSVYSGSFPAGASAGTSAGISVGTSVRIKETRQADRQGNTSEITAEQADEMALALTNKIWVWEWVEFFVPYMTKEGAEKLVSASRHSEWAGYIDHTTGKKLKFTKKQIRTARRHTPSRPLTSKALDSHALMIMQSNGDWDCISFMLPYMSKKGIRAVTRSYNSKHGDDKKRAADYY